MEKLNVAIADDNERMTDILGQMIEEDKELTLVGKAHNGEEICNIIREKEPDVVVLDMIMPKMGGHSTFYRIRELDPNIKVLLSSGYVAPDAVNDLLANGAAGFLQKPHRIKTLAYELRRILDTPAQEKTPSPV